MGTKRDILHDVTRQFVSVLQKEDRHDLDNVRRRFMKDIRLAFDTENMARGKGAPLKPPDDLSALETIPVLLKLFDIKLVFTGDIRTASESDKMAKSRLMIYQEDGPEAGLYVDKTRQLYHLAKQLSIGLLEPDFTKNYITTMRMEAPEACPCKDPWYIPVGNGVYDERTGKLIPYSPDMVFINKSPIPYFPDATDRTFQNPDGTLWTFNTWFQSLHSNPDVVRLLFQMMSASIRHDRHYDQMFLLNAPDGNNGKGTLCELIRELAGRKNCASISIPQFDEPFGMAKLLDASLIIADENPVDVYLQDGSKIKAVVTGDPVQVNRKYENPVDYCFPGIMIQCTNGLPLTKDKSDSFYRRIICIPMDQNFTGIENKAIKHVYLKDPSILQYVMKLLLEYRFKNFDIPMACQLALLEYKQDNDPIRMFWDEMENELVWDLLPYQFLFDLYKAWLLRYSPGRTPEGRNKFKQGLCNILKQNENWETRDSGPISAYNKMTRTEHLIIEYGLTGWMNESYKGNDPDKICKQDDTKKHRGLLRKNPTVR